MAAFSFYPGKNLGACGEAGAVTSSEAGRLAFVRKLREHGQAEKYYHDVEGYNGRLDALQAAFLRIKLRHLEQWTQARRAIADCIGRSGRRIVGSAASAEALRPAVVRRDRP